MVGVKEMHTEKCPVASNEEISCGIYEIIIKCPSIADSAKPGQFLHVKAGNGMEPLLRRPISINRIDRENGTITFIYQVVGRGTALISRVEAGEYLDVLGPLGNPFPLRNSKKCAVVGGGIGTAPLLELAVQLQDCDAYLGFRSEPYKIEEFRKHCNEVNIATEDGSTGYKGFVTEILARNLKNYACVYTCGPAKMMKIVKDMCKAENIECYVSVEERMGCGVGACLVCACKTVNEKGESHYKKACVDGPVFNAEEVELDEQ